MKRYLDLVNISSKKHKSSSRLTKLCIVLSVFLVSVILGMADASINCQINQEINTSGNWHLIVNVNQDDAKLISMRNDVSSSGRVAMEENSVIGENHAPLMVIDKSVFDDIFRSKITEGNFPQTNSEIIMCESAKKSLGVKIGDKVKLNVNNQNLELTICGFCDKILTMQDEQPDLIVMGPQGFEHVSLINGTEQIWIQFKNYTNITQSINNIKEQFSIADEELIEHTGLIRLQFQSDKSYHQTLYGCALILSLLVVIAAIMMITSSINIDVAQKTEFFGMMRCLGATKKQVKRYVRREALGYCRTGIPIGIILAIVVIWGLCFLLKTISPMIFDGMPSMFISYLAIIFGVLIGLLTVLLSAMSPARKASKVSPLTAVSGNAENLKPIKKAVNTKHIKIDTVLGIHHATGNKKNFVLMICSFALSIILFLSFSVTVDFMKKAVVSAQDYAPDIVLTPNENKEITAEQISEISKIPNIKALSRRMDSVDIDSTVDGQAIKINLISFDDNQFNWAKEKFETGDISTVQNSNEALIVYDRKKPVELGSDLKFKVNDKTNEIQVGAVVSSVYDKYTNDAVNIIVSERTFTELTGSSKLSSIQIKIPVFCDSSVVDKVKTVAGNDLTVHDYIETNKSARGGYFAFAFFIYGFLVVIALIAVTNIINSVAMGVNSRKKEYGFMRAVGMSDRQLLKTITAQTMTYSIFGCIVGCIPGILINKALFDNMVGFHWGVAWQFPTLTVLIIVLLILITSIFAVLSPYKKIKNMNVVDNISCQ